MYTCVYIYIYIYIGKGGLDNVGVDDLRICVYIRSAHVYDCLRS